MRWPLSLLAAGSMAQAHTAPALPNSEIAKPSGQFGLPSAGKPGPNTWRLGQPYKNTVGAYRQARGIYAAIQGIRHPRQVRNPGGRPRRWAGGGGGRPAQQPAA